MKVSKADGTASDGGALVAAITHLEDGTVRLDRADGTFLLMPAGEVEVVDKLDPATTA